MHSFSILGAAIALTSIFSPVLGNDVKDYTVEVCATRYATTPVKSVGTTTEYTTIHQTVQCVEKVIPTSTVTPKPTTTTATITAYKTVTKTLTNVQTLSSTQTVINPVTITTPTTVTAFATSTVNVTVTPTSTVTVPTSDGFIYASSAPDIAASTEHTYDPFNADNKKRAAKTAHRADVLAGNRPVPRNPNGNGGGSPTTKSYEASVTCGVLVDEITTNHKTITATQTATVTGKPSVVPQTSTVTSTVTSTIVQGGAATTIVTTTTLSPTVTVPLTITVTSTGTITATATARGPTFYAACNSQNLVNNIPNAGGAINDNGLAVDDINWDGVYGTADSAYDCCVQCITSDNCGGGFFYSNTGVCVNTQPFSTCDPTQREVQLNYVSGPQDEAGDITIFDGNCGLVYEEIGA
ncbi:MAG: hypothetical protein Q9191_007535 [Dirinaria sp. TL-2023a]